ncbi:FRIGIDA-like protein [Prunus dulcis]|uniref:FRIGIDA-like protein n=1 Tax=Prunus dulcis TaxID=3755 RepID=A0A4Y1RX18_PRUDU|nr:FRIGIDA-like protein [Prunus dulcis]
MGTELVVTTDRVQKFFDDLEAQKAILSTSTKLFTTLSKHFNSLQDSLSQKSQSLESKIQSLESRSRETLESLDLRETSIPERESAAAARIEEQKAAALAEFEKSISGNLDLPETLKSFSRKMDPQGLLKFIVSKRKESISLRTELVQAIAEAVDPPKLVLDALEGFLDSKAKKIGVTDKRWACGLLVQALFPEGRSNSCEKGPEFSRSMVERAARIADTWKAQMVGDSNGGGGTLGAAEAVMFVQMVIGFRLKEKFSEEFFRKLVMEHAARRDMAKLAGALEFGEKMGDVIDELVKNGKEIEAVYFASETGLTERFPPVSLLKSYLRNSKKNATTILRNGNNSLAATEESSTLELNSIKAIIKCVEDHKLESEFSLDSLRKRATHLEKAKAERKKSSAASSSLWGGVGGGGGGGGRGVGSSSFRPAKAAKFSNAYPSFNRRNPNPPPQHSPATRYSGPYNYPSQSVYDGPTAALPPQHFSLSGDNMAAGGFRSSGAYGGQTSYGPYDYTNAAPPSYQPPSYPQ